MVEYVKEIILNLFYIWHGKYYFKSIDLIKFEQMYMNNIVWLDKQSHLYVYLWIIIIVYFKTFIKLTLAHALPRVIHKIWI